MSTCWRFAHEADVSGAAVGGSPVLWRFVSKRSKLVLFDRLGRHAIFKSCMVVRQVASCECSNVFEHGQD